MKKIELTKKGKIILSILGVLIVGIITFLVIPKNNIEGISIEMAMPNEGFVVDDPIFGMTVELKVGKKIKLLETIHPEKAKNKKTEYVSENPEIAYIDEEGNLVGKSAGATRIYSQTPNGKIKSNIIEIGIVE